MKLNLEKALSFLANARRVIDGVQNRGEENAKHLGRHLPIQIVPRSQLIATFARFRIDQNALTMGRILRLGRIARLTE